MMKILFSFIVVFMVSKECEQSNKNRSTNNLKLHNNTRISYEVMSRGYFKYIAFNNDKILITTDLNKQKMDTLTISKKEWNDLQKLINTLDLNTLKNLKAPTDKRLYDGAAHCTMSVILKDKTYTTPSFDEGFPPEEIKPLVNKMLSISENYPTH